MKGAQFLSGLSARLRGVAGSLVAQGKALLTQLIGDFQRMGAAAKGALGKLMSQLVQPVVSAVQQLGGLGRIFSGDPMTSLKNLVKVLGKALLARVSDSASARLMLSTRSSVARR